MADLKPANENPWYVLMTLYGEQDEPQLSTERHTQNSKVWNAWACQCLTANERKRLLDGGVDLPAADSWDQIKAATLHLHREQMESRNKQKAGFKYPGFPEASKFYDLAGTEFDKKVALAGFIFARQVRFNGSNFRRWVNFRTLFSLGVFEFGSSVFYEHADFSNAKFLGGVSFRGGRFEQGAYFYDVYSPYETDFVSTNFEDDASFTKAIFGPDLDFWQAVFKKQASFRSVKFRHSVSFKATKFHSNSEFTEAEFGLSEFKDSSPALVDLSDTQFDKPANFRDAKFLNRFPDFTGAIVHDKTIFPLQKHAWPNGYPLFDEHWTPEEHDRNRIALMREAANSCAFLRHHVKGQGLPEAEYLFFKREMGFLAEIGGWWQRLPYRLFGWSEYGTSIQRPVFCLAMLWLVPALVYMTVFNYLDATTGPPNFSSGSPFGYSFSNIFGFFGLQRLYFDKAFVEPLGPWLDFMAAMQTVFGFVFLFFLGLGLRARFRLR